MDVHPPHEPIHSIRDFLIHLLTITVGLLIALGLEATAEHFHHRSLVKEARANLASEITDNQRSISGFLKDISAAQKTAQQAIDTLEDVRRTHSAKDKHFGYNWSFTGLQDTSWNTAQITGAIAYMDYGDAKRYAEIYNVQKLFVNTEDQALESVDNIGMPRDPSTLTDEQLRQLEHGISVAMLHFDTLRNIATTLNRNYNEFLEHK